MALKFPASSRTSMTGGKSQYDSGSTPGTSTEHHPHLTTRWVNRISSSSWQYRREAPIARSALTRYPAGDQPESSAARRRQEWHYPPGPEKVDAAEAPQQDLLLLWVMFRYQLKQPGAPHMIILRSRIEACSSLGEKHARTTAN